MARYIDAEDFMNRIIKKYHCNPMIDGGGNNYGYLDLELNEQPTADVRTEQHAKWMRDDYQERDFDGSYSNIISYKCSSCNMNTDWKKTQFCGHCSATMDLESEE